MKRRAWEETGRGEALPALPSGLDEEDRKRIRTADEGQEDRPGDNKKIRVSEDIDTMNDEEWTEYIDEIRSRRNIMLVIPDVNKRATGKYENRACIMAEVQDSLGSYYVMELGQDKEVEYGEHLATINAHKITINGCTLWTNAEEVVRTARESTGRTIVEVLEEGTRRQVRYRDWEEDHQNWAMCVDNLG